MNRRPTLLLIGGPFGGQTAEGPSGDLPPDGIGFGRDGKGVVISGALNFAGWNVREPRKQPKHEGDPAVWTTHYRNTGRQRKRR